MSDDKSGPKPDAFAIGSFIAIPLENAGSFDDVLADAKNCATAVGNLCFVWGVLETSLDKLIRSILKIDDEKLAYTLLNNIDFRSKMQIALGIGHLSRLSDDWFDTLKWCIDYTNNSLRPRRNRAVHNLLRVSPSGMKSVQSKTGFRKHQASQEPEYYVQIETPITVAEIDELTSECQKMAFRFDFLWRAGFSESSDWKRLIEEHAPLPDHQ